MDKVNTDMLRGRVDIIVLNALSEKDGYGYDILNYIETRTEGHYQMKQSSIYSVLKRLEKVGHISSYTGGNESNGAKRRYYTLTDSGRQILDNEKKEWSYTRTLLDNLVSDDDFDLKVDTPPFSPSDLRPLTKRTATVSVVDEANEKAPELNANVTQEAYSTTLASNKIVENRVIDDEPIQNNNLDMVQKSNNVLNHNERSTEYHEMIDFTENTTCYSDFDIAKTATINKSQSPLFNNIDNSTTKSNKNSAAHQLFDVSVNETIKNDESLNFDQSYSSKPLEKQNLNLYKDVLGSIFKSETTIKNTPKQEAFENIDCKYIYDLKALLKNEGHQLKEYSPSSSKSTIKYLSINKLIRDSLFLSFLFYVITILVLFLARNYFEISKTVIYIVGGLGILSPIAALIIYYQNPNKRKKDTINLKLIINICFIVYLAAFMINLIVALIVPNGYSLNSLHIYAPCFVLLTIPIFSIIFAALYKSDKYHLN